MSRRGWQAAELTGYERRSTAGDTPCARGFWCATATRTEAPGGGFTREPAGCEDTFCATDESIISECLSALPEHYVRLDVASREWVTPEVIIRLPFGPSAPVRTDVDEVQRALVECVAAWHELLATAAGLAEPDTQDTRSAALHRRAGKLLADCVPKLREHQRYLLALPRQPLNRHISALLEHLLPAAEVAARHGDLVILTATGADAGNEILHLEYTCRAVLGDTEPAPERLLGVPCRRCPGDKRQLRRAAPPQHEGDPVYASECTVCGHLMTPEEYAQWTRRQASYWQDRTTPAQLAATAGVGERDAARILAGAARDA